MPIEISVKSDLVNNTRSRDEKVSTNSGPSGDDRDESGIARPTPSVGTAGLEQAAKANLIEGIQGADDTAHDNNGTTPDGGEEIELVRKRQSTGNDGSQVPNKAVKIDLSADLRIGRTAFGGCRHAHGIAIKDQYILRCVLVCVNVHRRDDQVRSAIDTKPLHRLQIDLIFPIILPAPAFLFPSYRRRGLFSSN